MVIEEVDDQMSDASKLSKNSRRKSKLLCSAHINNQAFSSEQSVSYESSNYVSYESSNYRGSSRNLKTNLSKVLSSSLKKPVGSARSKGTESGLKNS